jgi:uncharacterized damage-inducible protein DinB
MTTARNPRADPILDTWRLCADLTRDLVGALPPEVWPLAVPGSPRRTVRSIAAHLHNCRCMWIKTAGAPDEVPVPDHVDRANATQKHVCAALTKSARGIESVLAGAIERDRTVRGFALDATHFLAYHAAHEGHHRGQLLLIARQLGHRLPREVQSSLWQWSKRAKEV